MTPVLTLAIIKGYICCKTYIETNKKSIEINIKLRKCIIYMHIFHCRVDISISL